MHQNFTEDKVDLQKKFTDKYLHGTDDVAAFQNDLSDLIKLCATQKNQDGSIPVLLFPHHYQELIDCLEWANNHTAIIAERLQKERHSVIALVDLIQKRKELISVMEYQLSSGGYIANDPETNVKID